ncbi:MAG: transcription termination/antitermination protein NusG [Waddliaceae bacterium]|nr:transcription termination/antitermination protein NusG [Waddliaceae bacterium]
MSADSYKWYVVQVLSGQEKKAKKSLEECREQHGLTDLIEEVLLPVENVSEVKQGQRVVREKRLWPGYLLLKMILNDDTWGYVKNTNGVINFAGGDKPTPLIQEEVEEILRDLEDKSQRVVQKHKFNVGDRVKIVDGVFANMEGDVLSVQHDKGRVSVVVSVFQRDTQVDDLEFWQIEEVTDEVVD